MSVFNFFYLSKKVFACSKSFSPFFSLNTLTRNINTFSLSQRKIQNNNILLVSTQQRGIATQPPFIHLPPPPPREYNTDGTPKKYRLNQKTYDHKYDWERWGIRPAGVFHTVYYGEFAKDAPRLQAWLLQYHLSVAYFPYVLACLGAIFIFSNLGSIGIKPKRYTIEWMEASKERDRAENTNAVTRYLDRRRKERGSHWLMEDYLPTHPFFLHMRNHHDTQLLREKGLIEE